jgi:hypothetical protein
LTGGLRFRRVLAGAQDPNAKQKISFGVALKRYAEMALRFLGY